MKTLTETIALVMEKHKGQMYGYSIRNWYPQYGGLLDRYRKALDILDEYDD